MSRDRAVKKLFKVEKAIDKISKSSKPLSSRQHRKLRRHLKRRASVLSDLMGVKIHSICD